MFTLLLLLLPIVILGACFWIFQQTERAPAPPKEEDPEGLCTCVVIDFEAPDTTVVMDAEQFTMELLAKRLSRRGIPAICSHDERHNGRLRLEYEQRVYIIKTLEWEPARMTLRVDLESGEPPPEEHESLEVLGTLHYILRTLDHAEFWWYRREDLIARRAPRTTPY